MEIWQEFREFVDTLHKNTDFVEPQYARIEGDTATYAFRVRSYRDAQGRIMHPGTTEMYRKVADITASALQIVFPEFSITSTQGEEVHVSYKPSDGLEEIRKFFESIPKNEFD